MQIASTYDLFIHELGEIYDAEHRFLEGQEEMAPWSWIPLIRRGTYALLESAPQNTEDTQHHVGDDEHDDDYGGVLDEGRSDDPAAS